jgi:uncharacterized membrane protein YdjX (TVP38/TMEM64 family)
MFNQLHLHRWKPRNFIFLAISLIVFIYLIELDSVKVFISSLGEFGYLGAFLAGIFFVSIFTVVPAIAVLLIISTKLNFFGMSFVGGLGSIIGNYIIYEFFKDGIYQELKPMIAHTKESYLIHVFRTTYFNWMVVVAGAIVLASPLPDELGLSILGLTNIKRWQFLLMSFVFNTIGIFAIISLRKFY